MIWPLLTGLWRLVVSLPFWWLYLVKHSPMHGLCHCLELFINSMWWVYKVHSFHKEILLIATSNCRLVSCRFLAIFCQAEVHWFSLRWSTATLSCLALLRKELFEGRAFSLAKPGCPWCLTFALGRLGNHSFFGRNPMLVTLNFTGSDLRALFNFFQEQSLVAVWIEQWNQGVVYLLSVLGCSV